MEQYGSKVSFPATSSLHVLPMYTENPHIYPLRCSDTMNSFIWTLLGLEGLNCKNFTHPLKTIVDSSKEMYLAGV